MHNMPYGQEEYGALLGFEDLPTGFPKGATGAAAGWQHVDDVTITGAAALSVLQVGGRGRSTTGGASEQQAVDYEEDHHGQGAGSGFMASTLQ